jgi:GAF domain-containing protein
VSESFKKPDKILKIIREVNEAISLSNGNQNVLTTALDALTEVLKVKCCWVQLIRPQDQRLVLAAQRGFTGAMRWEISTSPTAQELGNRIAVYGHKIVVPHLSRQNAVDLKSFRMARLRSLVAVPMTTYRTSGVLGIASAREKRFGQDAAELLTVIAGMLGTALEKAELYERVAGHEAKAPPPDAVPPIFPKYRASPK